MLRIDALDHVVLTVASIERTIAFYEKLGMTAVSFGDGRRALRFGRQKINLHEAGREFVPKALRPMPGSADLCFLTATPVAEVAREFSAAGIAIEEGPVKRTGAVRPLMSVYLRDPDGNLIEIANELPAI